MFNVYATKVKPLHSLGFFIPVRVQKQKVGKDLIAYRVTNLM